MSNTSLALQLPTLDILYTPLPIKIEGESELKAAMESAAKHYSNLIVTEDTAKEARKTKADLNKIINHLESKRKEVKRNFNQPVRDMEARIKGLESVIVPVVGQINHSLMELDNRRKIERIEFIEKQIAEMAPNYHVDPRKILIDTRWLNKSMSNKELLSGIGGAMKQANLEHQLLKSQKAELKSYAESFGLQPDGWINQLESGFDLDDIKSQIELLVATKKAESEAKKAKQVEVAGKLVDRETGEIIKTSHYKLMLEATEEQAKTLTQFLKANGYEYEMEVI